MIGPGHECRNCGLTKTNECVILTGKAGKQQGVKGQYVQWEFHGVAKVRKIQVQQGFEKEKSRTVHTCVLPLILPYRFIDHLHEHSIS